MCRKGSERLQLGARRLATVINLSPNERGVQRRIELLPVLNPLDAPGVHRVEEPVGTKRQEVFAAREGRLAVDDFVVLDRER